MCCDGVLFDSVILQHGESARALSALGLKIRRKKSEEFFLQPCSAHQGCECAIYHQRPERCRRFRCRQLLGVASGEIPEITAREKILEARELVAHVNQLINRIAETNANRSLSRRCANALTTSAWTPLHDELKSAMNELNSLLDREFRIK
jgi:Fe-S-cluster containining protein